MHIVIVDDTLANLKLMESLVKKTSEDFKPIVFQDPLECLNWCAGNETDLLITDFMMPDVDGIELIGRFREIAGNQDIPVLMVTADHEKQTRYAALQSGANDFLTKPVDAAEFRARVNNMITIRRSQRALADRATWLEEEVSKRTAWIMDREREMIMRLSRAAEFRDPETGAHIQRMSNYSFVIANQLDLPVEEQQLILKAAPMHDVGKIAIPDGILLKPGRLDEGEFVIMKTHAEAGYQILCDSPSDMLQAAAIIARSHHEKFDGTGYPQGLRGKDIPLHGRIVAVADVFDALTTARPYKEAWEVDKALDFLKINSGSHFDPACVDAFMARLDDILAIRSQYQDAHPVMAQL